MQQNNRILAEPEYPLALHHQEELLASVFVNPDILPEVCELIDESHFAGHMRTVFLLFRFCYEHGHPFRPKQLADTLEAKFQSGENRNAAIRFIVDCHQVPLFAFTAACWEYYANQLVRAKVMRTLYDVGLEVYELSKKGHAEPDEILDVAYQALDGVETATHRHQGTRQFGTILDELIEVLGKRKTERTGSLKTGLAEFDSFLGGLREGEMTVLAARPGQGKTALAMTIACNVAEAGGRVLVVSREMVQRDLAERCISGYSKVTASHLRAGTFTEEEFQNVIDAWNLMKVFQIIITDQRTKTPQQIAAEIRRQKMRGGLDLVVVDYLQLLRMTDDRLPAYERVSQVSGAMKELSLDYNVPMLVLAQLNREIEKRGKNAKPLLSDLRDSGAIEQDADNVLFLYRESSEENATPNESVNVVIAKQRKGPAGQEFELLWRRDLVKFENKATEWQTGAEEVKF